MSLLICVGLSHKTAPVEVREKATLSIQQQNTVLERVAAGHIPGIAEMVVVSTCNRTEIYGVAQPTDCQVNSQTSADINRDAAGEVNTAFSSLLAILREHSRLPDDALAKVVYCMAGDDVVRHLLSVTASLDSLVLGEPQILGQITQAYRRAANARSARATLSALMQYAIHTGKRAHSQTELGQGALSISAVAAHHASRRLGNLDQACALIIGAGEMAQLMAKALLRRGIRKLVIASRTFDHAQNVARPLGATAIPYTDVGAALLEADIVVTAAGAPHTLFHVADIERSLAQRADRPLLIFDIAVPRNVAPAVGSLPGVSLFNLDDLQAEADLHREERTGQIPQVEAIIEEEVAAFARWQASREIVPVIRELRDNAEAIRQAEFAKVARQLPDLSERDLHMLEMFSQRLVNKLLHQPTVQLKAHSAEGQSRAYAALIRDLFGLEGTKR